MFDYFIYTYGPTLVLSILCAVFGALGHAAKQLWRSYVNTKEKESAAYTVDAPARRRAFRYRFHEVSDMKKAASVFARRDLSTAPGLIIRWRDNPNITRYRNEDHSKEWAT